MLAGEQTWLAAVVADLADDTTKLAYADWLQERGDDRAAFLRQFVTAAKSMDVAEFPEPKEEYSTEWLDLIGYWFLHLLACADSAGLKEPELRHARPALRMKMNPTKDAKLAIGASKIGGLPDLPKGYSWPLGKECRAIYNDDTKGVEQLAGFLAQVNLAEIAHTQATKDLPKAGLLSFFSFQDIEHDKPDVIGAKAGYFPDFKGFVRTKPPEKLTEGNKEMPPARLTFEEALDLPDQSGPCKVKVPPRFERGYESWLSELREQNFENMLGYGRGTTGDDPTPDTNHRHLILLGNVSGCRLHIQIHQKDLAALDFGKIKLVWVDFD